MAIVTNGRLEYEMSTIDVTYPDIGKVTYRGSYPLIVSNQWMPPSKMPVKGDIITMDGKDYRVLKVNKNIVEVICMYDAGTTVFDIKSSYNNTYAEKNIDTYCNNTFYSGLSESIKSAIIDKTFTQDSWNRVTSAPAELHYTGKYNSNTYYFILINTTYGTSITRHCYCLSIQDVLDYLECTTSMGASDTTLTGINVLQMFWNTTTSQRNTFCLRSAISERSDYVFCINSNNGVFGDYGVHSDTTVRPAFQIDLSKVEYTIK